MKPINEVWARTIDCYIKLATAIALIVGGGWTAYRYFEDRQEQIMTQRAEAAKPFMQKRLELYVEATSAMATIATSKDEKQVASAREKFLILYHGPLRLLTGRLEARQPLAEFDECIETGKCGKSLKELADAFANELYLELQHDWLPNPPKDVSARQV